MTDKIPEPAALYVSPVVSDAERLIVMAEALHEEPIDDAFGVVGVHLRGGTLTLSAAGRGFDVLVTSKGATRARMHAVDCKAAIELVAALLEDLRKGRPT